MENKRTFFPEVETVWHKDYQTDYYRGVIIDQDDNVAERCPELRASYYSAKRMRKKDGTGVLYIPESPARKF